MTIDPQLCLDLWIRPVSAALANALDEPRLNTQAGIALLWRTAAVESAFRHRRQMVGRPPRPVGTARGYPQVEPATAADVARWCRQRGGRAKALADAMGWRVKDRATLAERCEDDQFLAFGLARLKYWMMPQAIPPAFDVAGQAGYWKQWYNTELGAGTVRHFLEAHARFLAPLERAMGWLS